MPSAMIFDDHEVGDDWNVSEAWVEEMRQHPTWNDQIVGGYASYRIYQHLGNLRPEELAKDELYDRVKDSEDAWPVLREFAYNAHRGPDGIRWSYHRDLGNTRLLMIASRGVRVLDENRRSMVDAEEWAWVSDKATGGFDHLLICSSLPLRLGPAMHHLQSWNERLCSGAWGERLARRAEGFRRSQDLDHWASFHGSFVAMVRLIADVAGQEVVPAEQRLDGTRIPHRPPPCPSCRRPQRTLTWRMTPDAALFENQIATLELEGKSATITFEKSVLDASKEPALKKLYRHRLA